VDPGGAGGWSPLLSNNSIGGKGEGEGGERGKEEEKRKKKRRWEEEKGGSPPKPKTCLRHCMPDNMDVPLTKSSHSSKIEERDAVSHRATKDTSKVELGTSALIHVSYSLLIIDMSKKNISGTASQMRTDPFVQCVSLMSRIL
jgi:hypothetical protein